VISVARSKVLDAELARGLAQGSSLEETQEDEFAANRVGVALESLMEEIVTFASPCLGARGRLGGGGIELAPGLVDVSSADFAEAKHPEVASTLAGSASFEGIEARSADDLEDPGAEHRERLFVVHAAVEAREVLPCA
jgi:hypothetical protein